MSQAIEPAKVPRSWDRLPEETEEAYVYFRRYLEQKPPRKKIRYLYGHATETIQGWATSHRWIKRARDYDAWIAEVFDEEKATTVREIAKAVAEEHVALLRLARETAVEEFQKLLQDVKDKKKRVISVSDLTKLMDHVVKLERLTFGASTEHVEVQERKGPDLSKLSLDELHQLHSIQQKLLAPKAIEVRLIGQTDEGKVPTSCRDEESAPGD